MSLRIYWFCQLGFVLTLPVWLHFASNSGAVTTAIFGVLAAVQFALVGWRLWIAESWPWLVLLPPAVPVLLWLALGPWAQAEVGGDGRGLLLALTAAAWVIIAYPTVAIWAGLRPIRNQMPRAS